MIRSVMVSVKPDCMTAQMTAVRLWCKLR